MGDTNPIIQFFHIIAGLLLVAAFVVTVCGVATGRHIK